MERMESFARISFDDTTDITPSTSISENFVKHFAPELVMPLALPARCSKDELRDILASFLVSSEDHDSSSTDNNENFEVPNANITKQISEQR